MADLSWIYERKFEAAFHAAHRKICYFCKCFFRIPKFMDLIQHHKKAVAAACLDNRVAQLYVFGSVLTDKFSADSDIDFIVSIDASDPIEYAEYYFNLKFELEKIFERSIDLLEDKSIANKYFEKLINQQKVLIYAGRNQGVA